MEIGKVKCSRCGKEENISLITTYYQEFESYPLENPPDLVYEEIHLCRECEKSFRSWLENKENFKGKE